MTRSYEPSGWKSYVMDWRGDPHPRMEDLAEEITVVDNGLAKLVEWGVLSNADYDHDKFLSHRAVIKDRFDVPWTGISPRMQRLVYAINASARPATMVAAGVFCGFTFINNAGAAIGPGACYEAERLVGIEIDPREAARAEENVRTVDPAGKAEIVAGDAVEWLRRFDGTVNLLYIDADNSYLDIVQAAGDGKLGDGSLVLAHNSVNMRSQLSAYLQFVRDPSRSRVSVNMCVDDQGLEVTVWKG